MMDAVNSHQVDGEVSAPTKRMAAILGADFAKHATPEPNEVGKTEPWSDDPHALASELRRVAGYWGSDYRLSKLLRKAADQIETTASPARGEPA